MAEVLLQKNVHARRIVALDKKSAQALSDGIRNRILEVLSHKPMSAEELAKALEISGNKKAVTTIRHHIDALRTAGLIEATKMVEVRGALMKYYAPTVRAFSYEVPPDLEENHARLVQSVSAKLAGVLKMIHADKRFQSAYGKGIPSCTLCKGNHFREYAAIEIINHALAKAMDGKEYAEFLSADKEPRNAKS